MSRPVMYEDWIAAALRENVVAGSAVLIRPTPGADPRRTFKAGYITFGLYRDNRISYKEIETGCIHGAGYLTGVIYDALEAGETVTIDGAPIINL